jgi:hypothetical protein
MAEAKVAPMSQTAATEVAKSKRLRGARDGSSDVGLLRRDG